MRKTSFIKAVGLLLASSAMSFNSYAEFHNLSVDFTNGNILASSETSATDFGINASNQRVESTSTDVVALFKGFKYHSDDHGLNPGTVEVAVEGNVKITIGTCNWGGLVTVKDASGSTVSSVNTSTGNCYHNDKINNVVSCNYSGAATTLSISGGSYWPYFAIEALTGDNVTVTYSIGSYTEAQGSVPAASTIIKDSELSIPVNKTLYLAGHTLTGWTDGTNTYGVGSSYTISSDLELTPVFTDTKELSERTDESVAKWFFGTSNAAPVFKLQGNSGVLVTQAIVDGTNIDVPLFIDATSGKFNSDRSDEWAQVNAGTKFTLEAAKNSVISMKGYNPFTSTTIDGDKEYENASVISYTYGGNDGNIEIVSGGDASYMSYIQITYPAVISNEINGEVSAFWANQSGLSNESQAVVSLDKAFTITTYTMGENLSIVTKNETGPDALGNMLTKYQPAASSAGSQPGYDVSYSVTPSKGLKFTPTNVSFKTLRYGTDGGLINVTYSIGEGAETALASDVKPNRNNAAEGCSVCSYDLTGIAETDEAFTLHLYIHSLGNTKQIGFSDINISGTVQGTLEEVAKYTLSAVATPEEGGSITIRPRMDVFEEGTSVKLSAERNFGYKFINWINADTKEELSSEEILNITMVADLNVQAVFAAINTYELIMSVTGGANDYQVSASPSPTTIDNRLMYEEGTAVTVTADSRPIIAFTNWTSGETSSEISFIMDDNKNVTANFEAADYIVGWDFHKSGNNGRIADFYSTTENEASTLILCNAEGTTAGWLDKSTLAAGGYEGLPAAVNWKNITDKYYYQIKFDATNFTDIKLASKMLYNYNAHEVQKVEYSLDGENFTTLNTVTLSGQKEWTDVNATLPAEADHAAAVFIRWIPDYTSSLVGTTANNDGTALSSVYVTGNAAIYNNGKAPILLSSIPADKATGASASGQIVLTFDKKIKVSESAKASLGNKTLTPSVTGKSIILPYTGLLYDTKYTFTMPANTVSDLSDNVLTEVLSIEFTTMQRSEVAKSLYDFIVDGTEGKTFADAVSAANANTSGQRFRIFVKKGQHDLGTGITAITASNVSVIGESEDNTILFNIPVEEGIGNTATIQLTKTAANVYMQDITLKNAYDYQGTTGRAVALQDQGNKNIFKNIKLLSFQDTYYSNNNSMRAYFEDCEIHGTVDFICGGGDIVFKRNLIFLEDRTGNVITAPATSTDWGYVFMDCTIDGYSSNNGSYNLGRPWQGSPRSVFLNTTMKVLPTAEGWTNMSQTQLPGLFAEYKSVTANGTAVDCSKRRTEFTPGKVSYDPVLSDEDAAKFTIENILAGSDQWVPTQATEQETALAISSDKDIISWTDSKYALLYAVIKDGSVVAFTTENTYTIPDDVETATYAVKAANEMGGLGESSNIISYNRNAIAAVTTGKVVSTVYYSIDGMLLAAPAQGVNIVKMTLEDGSVVVEKQLIR